MLAPVQYFLKNYDFVCQIFEGSSDKDTPVASFFPSTIMATLLKIRPTEWNTIISMRFEILGCKGRYIWQLVYSWKIQLCLGQWSFEYQQQLGQGQQCCAFFIFILFFTKISYALCDIIYIYFSNPFQLFIYFSHPFSVKLS